MWKKVNIHKVEKMMTERWPDGSFDYFHDLPSENGGLQKMTELEKKANSSWEKNNTVSIEADNEDAYKAGKDMNVPIKWHKVREFTPEEAKYEIELLKTIIKFLQNRGFAWDMFLRPFRLMYYKHQLKKLKAIAGGKA